MRNLHWASSSSRVYFEKLNYVRCERQSESAAKWEDSSSGFHEMILCFQRQVFLFIYRMRSQHFLCLGPRLACPFWGQSLRTWRTCTAATRCVQPYS